MANLPSKALPLRWLAPFFPRHLTLVYTCAACHHHVPRQRHRRHQRCHRPPPQRRLTHPPRLPVPTARHTGPARRRRPRVLSRPVQRRPCPSRVSPLLCSALLEERRPHPRSPAPSDDSLIDTTLAPPPSQRSTLCRAPPPRPRGRLIHKCGALSLWSPTGKIPRSLGRYPHALGQKSHARWAIRRRARPRPGSAATRPPPRGALRVKTLSDKRHGEDRHAGVARGLAHVL